MLNYSSKIKYLLIIFAVVYIYNFNPLNDFDNKLKSDSCKEIAA